MNVFDSLNEATTDIPFVEETTQSIVISETTITFETDGTIATMTLPIISETIEETTVPFLQKPLKDYSNVEISNSLICIILVAILLVLSFKEF